MIHLLFPSHSSCAIVWKVIHNFLQFPKRFTYYSQAIFLVLFWKVIHNFLQFGAHVHTNVIIERQGLSDRLNSLRCSNQMLPIIPTLCSWSAHYSCFKKGTIFLEIIGTLAHVGCFFARLLYLYAILLASPAHWADCQPYMHGGLQENRFTTIGVICTCSRSYIQMQSHVAFPGVTWSQHSSWRRRWWLCGVQVKKPRSRAW